MFSLVQLAQQGGGGAGGGFGSTAIMMLLMIGVIYLMMIRPQQKKAKEHQEWLKNLKKGDEVVTQGGTIGRITGMNEQVVILEIQEKVRMRVLRTSISGKPPEIKRPAPAATSEEKAAEEKK